MKTLSALQPLFILICGCTQDSFAGESIARLSRKLDFSSSIDSRALSSAIPPFLDLRV